MNLLNRILNHIFGRKYYANIINTRGTSICEISCVIFLDREEADEHRHSLDTNLSFMHVETISFRSRNEYRRLQGTPHVVADNEKKKKKVKSHN